MPTPSASESRSLETSSAPRDRSVPTEPARERAQRALKDSPVFDLRELHVERIGDSLLIRGRVDSFYHKQLAQESIRAVVGHYHVINQVNVHQEDLEDEPDGEAEGRQHGVVCSPARYERPKPK